VTAVAISMGDALGIGPEVVALALQDPAVRAAVEPVIYGQREALARAARMRSVPFEARVVEVAAPDLADPAAKAGALALACVDAAARAALEGSAAALCTAPLSKERVALTAKDFVGHTERLAELANARVAMMLAGPRLRVVLATNHVALRDVPQKLTAERIAFVAQLAAESLRTRFGLQRPRVAVLGLNPHAGDGGIFGDEEARVVRETVNVTLGLPFPRTSPDHGTADDIAWKGVADPQPMISALLLAAKLGR
jgi:4-hydroxythreonine-4-phosphate dehydrogenase